MTMPTMGISYKRASASSGPTTYDTPQNRRNSVRGELPSVSGTIGENRTKNNRALIILREQARARKLQHYLKSVVQEGDADIDTALSAWNTLWELESTMLNKLPIPNAGVGPEGEILLSWDKAEHHFEVETLPDGTSLLFYINHETNAMWEYEYKIGEAVSKNIQDTLKLFFLYD